MEVRLSRAKRLQFSYQPLAHKSYANTIFQILKHNYLPVLAVLALASLRFSLAYSERK
jgi:hypothetical protein